MLGYSKEELKTMEDNYQIPSKYAIDIIKNYGTMEAFVEAYKKCQCNYDFKNDIFCGFRGITISKNDMSEYKKLQYALAIKDTLSLDIKDIELNTGKYLDIDEFESEFEALSEENRNVFRYYYGLDEKKYTYKEIGKMFGVSSQRIGERKNKAMRMLAYPPRSKNVIRCFQNDYREITEYNREFDNLKSEIEDLQIINDYLSNKDYKSKNIELSNIIVNKDKLANLNKENIINIQDLMQKYYNINKKNQENLFIEDLSLSVRAYNALKKARLDTLSDLLNLTEYKLSRIRNLGANTRKEIINKIASMGLKLKEDGEVNEKNMNEVLNVANNNENMIEFFKYNQKIRLEKLEEISDKKDYLKNKIERYYLAVEQYLNNEDIFNSEFNVLAINVHKGNIESVDNIKKILDDLKIINDNNFVNDEKDVQNDKNEENIANHEEYIDKVEQRKKDINLYLEKYMKNLNAHKSEIEWVLVSDGEPFYKVDKHIIENELNKLDALELDFLILEPSKNIDDTIFLQVCINTTIENDKKENNEFYIELGFYDINNLVFGKDNLTKAEVLKIFIEYFENNKLPEIKNWQAIQI